MKKKKRPRKGSDHLLGLDGGPADVMAVRVTSITDAIHQMRLGAKAVTTAGDKGALTVWRNDKGELQCEFDRYMMALSKLTATAMLDVHKWLREWWPQLGR